MQNRLNTLNNSRSIAASTGDIDAVVSIETQINDTQVTLKQLMSLV